MKNKDSLSQVIKMLNSGEKYPALDLVKKNPELAVVMSKMIKSKMPNEVDISNKETHYNLNQGQIKSISDRIQNRIKDNESIMQLFPDIELATQILISSILSPKDMVKTEINYRTENLNMASEISMKLCETVKEHLDGYYKVKDSLQDILRDSLFDVGCYVNVILPESIVDEIINGDLKVSTEAMSDLLEEDQTVVSLGILGSPVKRTNSSGKISLENFANTGAGARIAIEEKGLTIYDEETKKTSAVDNSMLEITDNFQLLKLPKIIEKERKSVIKSFTKSRQVSLEAHDDSFSVRRIKDIVYKDPMVPMQNMVVIPKADSARRRSLGRPLVMKLPAESTIPIYMPGDEKNHIGYFVMTDADGNPITVNSNLDHMQSMGLGSNIMNQQQNQSLSSMLISKARRNLTDQSAEPSIDQISRIYTSIVEQDLMERLKNGINGSSVEIGNNEEIYKIMLARSLANSFTRLIYIPAELVGYFAFKYFKNGVGKSYLDDVKILSSLRAITLFSKVMAQVKNSINLTEVTLTLDPNDPDPYGTIEVAQNEVMRMRQNYFPLGVNSPVDLSDWMQRAGVEFSFEGHPRIPQTKFDFETKNMQHTLPDSDLDEGLRKQSYMTFGLSPEIVDNSFNAEFATTVISNNILLSKRVIKLQDILCKQLSEYSRKIINNDNLIIKDLLEVLVTNKAVIEKSLADEDKDVYNQDPKKYLEDLLDQFIECLYLDLPKPDITTIENQSTAYDQYSDSIDKTLDQYLGGDLISSDLLGDINNNTASIKAIVKGYFLRKWMADNGYMSELNDLVTSDEDGNATLDLYEMSKNHSEAVVRSSLKLIKELSRVKFAANQDLENMGVEEGSAATSDSSSSDDFGDSGDSGGDMGMDDFSF